MPRLKDLNVLANPIEGNITGYQIPLMKIFEGKLERLNNHDVKGLNIDELDNVSTTRKPGVDNFESEEEDEEEEDQSENKGEQSQTTKLHKLTELVEKSLQAPSQANKNLTNVKRIAQKSKLSKGNAFAEDGLVKRCNSRKTT